MFIFRLRPKEEEERKSNNKLTEILTDGRKGGREGKLNFIKNI